MNFLRENNVFDFIKKNKKYVIGVVAAIIVLVVVLLSLPSKKYYMYGPWIANAPVELSIVKTLNDGTKVYMFYSPDGYTKMVTEKNDAKYYVGEVDAFNPNKWDTYNAVPKDNYKLAVCPSSAKVSSTGECM